MTFSTNVTADAHNFLYVNGTTEKTTYVLPLKKVVLIWNNNESAFLSVNCHLELRHYEYLHCVAAKLEDTHPQSITLT